MLLGTNMISVGKTKFFEFMSNHGVINSSGSADLISKQDKRWLHNNNHSSQTTTLNEAVSETRKVSSLAHTEEFSLEDVSFHDTPTDCWVVIYDHVYDITPFLFEHPGGEEVMLEYAGRDATLAFRGVGHSKSAVNSLKPYKVGILIEEDRMWIGPEAEK
ncbi:cytochrome b5 isoform X2 [Folsomia candida]|uniref:cytochrome b5 isoform X2 n=1 Tax=Folsomia candida TaxID=158441 RepID=UPI001604F135|nr:cytochrome b5 isoform X2 [Folsomia candida]